MPITTSDDNRRQGSSGFTFAGPGLTPMFRCDKCGHRGLTTGRKAVKVGGRVVKWLCKGCK